MRDPAQLIGVAETDIGEDEQQALGLSEVQQRISLSAMPAKGIFVPTWPLGSPV